MVTTRQLVALALFQCGVPHHSPLEPRLRRRTEVRTRILDPPSLEEGAADGPPWEKADGERVGSLSPARFALWRATFGQIGRVY